MEISGRTLNDWIDYLCPKLYVIGILIIFMYAFFLGIQFKLESVKADTALQTNQTNVSAPKGGDQKTSGSTWLELVVRPVVESPFNRIIFHTLFLLLVWVLIFLIVPVAFYKLKRFRLFNLEFEVDKENTLTSINEILKNNNTKAQMMANLTGEQTQVRLLNYLDRKTIRVNIIAALEECLNELVKSYEHNFKYGITWELFKIGEDGHILSMEGLPQYVEVLVDRAMQDKQAICHNVRDNILAKNYLVYPFHFDRCDYVTVLSSYSIEFGDIDAYLLELLHNVLINYADGIEFGYAYANCVQAMPS